jgi:site-specific DNA-methyltransferase (adenine-specific)
MLVKRAGAEREVVGRDLSAVRTNSEKNHKDGQVGKLGLKADGSGLITAPATELSKKYSSYKYSVSPLKQIVETILVFRKPVLNSPVDDLLVYEKGDEKVYPVCVNIDSTRVPLATEYDKKHQADIVRGQGNSTNGKMFGGADIKTIGYGNENGRYTPQLIIQEEVAERMDEMSGERITGNRTEESFDKWKSPESPLPNQGGTNRKLTEYTDKGGMSKVFPKIKYYDDIDVPYMYTPKVSKKERMGSEHPTMKPIQLIMWLLKLFCAPDKEKINVLVPFSGSGSELVACELTGVKYKGIEINPEYVKIAEARLEKAKKEPDTFWNLLNKKMGKIKKDIGVVKESNEEELDLFL